MAQAEEFNASEGITADADIVERVLEGDLTSFELIIRTAETSRRGAAHG